MEDRMNPNSIYSGVPRTNTPCTRRAGLLPRGDQLLPVRARGLQGEELLEELHLWGRGSRNTKQSRFSAKKL